MFPQRSSSDPTWNAHSGCVAESFESKQPTQQPKTTCCADTGYEQGSIVGRKSPSTKRARFTFTLCELPQCKNCKTVFSGDRDPRGSPCTFHMAEPQPFQVQYKNIDKTNTNIYVLGENILCVFVTVLGKRDTHKKYT